MLIALLLVTHQEQQKARENLIKILDREAPDIAYKLYQAMKDEHTIIVWLWHTRSEMGEPLARLVQERAWNSLDREVRRQLPEARYV